MTTPATAFAPSWPPIADLLHAVSNLSTLAWLALWLWCLPAVFRLAYRGQRARQYDPMRLVVLLMTSAILSFSALRWTFGLHIESFSMAEARGRLLAYAASIAIAGATVFIVRSYDRTADR